MSDFALSIVLGIALAAATGFRVFLPMLIVSGAAYTGHLSLDNSFAWLATPAALVAGTVVSAAVMTDVPPMVKWTAAVIVGGGIAGLTQGVTAMLRAHSTVLTGGLGNPVIATAELGAALIMSFLALVVPAVAIALIFLFLWLAIRLLHRRFRGSHSTNGLK